MKVGVSLPNTESRDDFGALHDYLQAAEDLGYDHVRTLDHVLGADPQFHPEVSEFPYTHQSHTHEPFTSMSYLAAITERLHLVTGILILPQRLTALVGNWAAEVDLHPAEFLHRPRRIPDFDHSLDLVVPVHGQ